MLRALIYGDVNLNYRDGSAIWLQSLARCLQLADVQVDVLLKADVRNPSLLEPLVALPALTIHTPFDDRVSGMAGMSPRQAAHRIVEIDRRKNRFDLIITRGFQIAAQLAVSKWFTNRFWSYITEGPMFEFTRTSEQERLCSEITNEARRVLVQTEEARAIVEALVPGAAGKTIVMTPIVPDEAFDLAHSRAHTGELDMVYAGKFARLWNTLDMVTLPRQLNDVGLRATVTMIGDKVQQTGDDADWVTAMKEAMSTPANGVTFTGGLSRRDTLAELARHELGLCWRDPALDSSHELSTKMLEYAAIGTAPILNRTVMHEALLGADYPLFVDDGNIIATLRRAGTNSQLVVAARRRAYDAVAPYAMAPSVERLRVHLERAFGAAQSGTSSTAQLRVLLAGHDFKFAGELIEMLRQNSEFKLRIDKWKRLAVHDEKASAEAAKWADTIICEWAGTNAAFFSKIKRPNQRLLVRFHGFEIRGAWLKDIDITQVDAFIFVSDFYRKQVLRKTGWPESITTVIPNTIDALDLDRPKSADARYTLGLAGYVPMLKRPDRALDLLELLLERDTRFRLRLRGRLPWSYPWEWNKPAQRDAYEEFFARIANSDLLQRHVSFDPFGPDMGTWFRQIGWMLSPSTRETFHLAPVEGMATGALPVVWERDGAAEIFGADLVQEDTQSAAQFVLDNLEGWGDRGDDMKRRVERFDLMEVRTLWFDLVNLPQGAPIPLHGTPLIDEYDGNATDPGMLRALLEPALQEGNVDQVNSLAAAYDATRYGQLSEDLEGRLQAARVVTQWVIDPNRFLPPAGQVPAFHPASGVILDVTGDPDAELVMDPVGLTHRDDHDVHLLADSMQRTARRERAETIRVADVPGPTAVAATLAARRLGLPIEWTRTPTQRPRDMNHAWQALHDACHQARTAQPRPLNDIRIGLLADEFTTRTISATVPTVVLRRSNWQQQIESESLDAVIVESAWEGVDKEWFHGVAYHGEKEASDLWELLDCCRQLAIPTCFWNKEDPVHFDSFHRAAEQFDHVFTTDAAMIPRYLESATAFQTVQALPFFVSPRLHNPLPMGRALEKTIAFAGSYYGDRYPERSAELKMILEEAAMLGLTIYDRQQGRPGSPYQLPNSLKPYSVGSVDYTEMADVYRAHPVHINVNSVRESPSMFSRRVVEIPACGSLVLSGVGGGVRHVLGSAFPTLTSRDEWHDHLTTFMGNTGKRQDAVAQQYLTLMRAHRADQAMTIMLRTCGIPVSPESASRALDITPVGGSNMTGWTRYLLNLPLD